MRIFKICRKIWIGWGMWGAVNGMKMNPSKCRAVRFTMAWVKDLLNYTLGDQWIAEESGANIWE
jgi:hypothetical protein